MIENVVVKNSAWTQRDIDLLFGDENVRFTEANDLPGLLKELGVFKSTSEARRAGRTGDIPTGFAELKASKKHRIWIWNPTE